MSSAVQVRLVCKNQRSGSLVEYICDLPITIGRSTEFSTIVIQDRAISRQHARLELEDYHLVLRDLNSANGTMVNGERIQRVALKSGDLINIGPYQFSWSYVDQGADATILFTPASTNREAVPARTEETIAARKVVEAAEAYNRAQGHEQAGLLRASQKRYDHD